MSFAMKVRQELRQTWQRPVAVRISNSRLLYLALVIAFVSAPLVETLLLVNGLFGASLADYVPATDDEMYLWRQEATFAEVGFTGGYYTFEEQPAALAFTRYGPHGPVFPLIYGSLGGVMGWRPNTGIVLNVLLVTAALAFFVYAARPGRKQMAVLVLLIASFWPLLWQVPANLQESFHQAVAIVLAGLLYPWLVNGKAISARAELFLLLGIVVVSLARPFWALLYVPFALLGLRGENRVIAWFKALAVIGFSFVAVIYLAAPYPNFVRAFMEELGNSWGSAGRLFLTHLGSNLEQFFTLGDRNQLFPLERYQLLTFCLYLSGFLLFSLWRWRGKGRLRDWLAANRVEIFHFVNLAGILGTVVLFYIAGGDQAYRVYAPYLLMTVLLLVLGRRYQLVGVLIASNVLATPLLVQQYERVKVRILPTRRGRWLPLRRRPGRTWPTIRQWGHGRIRFCWTATCFAARCAVII